MIDILLLFVSQAQHFKSPGDVCVRLRSNLLLKSQATFWPCFGGVVVVVFWGVFWWCWCFWWCLNGVLGGVSGCVLGGSFGAGRWCFGGAGGWCFGGAGGCVLGGPLVVFWVGGWWLSISSLTKNRRQLQCTDTYSGIGNPNVRPPD